MTDADRAAAELTRKDTAPGLVRPLAMQLSDDALPRLDFSHRRQAFDTRR